MAPNCPSAEVDPEAVLHALPMAVLVLDGGGVVCSANPAAEQFLGVGGARLIGQCLDRLVRDEGAVSRLCAESRRRGGVVTEHGVALWSWRLGRRTITLSAGVLSDRSDHVALTIEERAAARSNDQRLAHRGAARAVGAVAAILAHEVKNPLAGIRGAAQLIEEGEPAVDRELTRLICEEADRICSLVDRIDSLADGRPIARAPVNIHDVLTHVRLLAQHGFARHVRMVESYDPSLPAVSGDRDLLIQLFLNLVKNAAEALPPQGGQVALETRYRHEVRVAAREGDRRVELPIMVTVSDNGHGVADEVRPHLFDPFVSTKREGGGLGLALVAKLVGEHDGIVEFDSEPGRTAFRVLLPVHGTERDE